VSRRRLAAALALLALTACNGGNYPVDVFPEMHYQQSQRRLEPNRLAPARGAVPVTGSAPRVNWDQARDLTDPVAATPERLQRGLALYQVNCAMCHGVDGHARTLTAAQIASSGNIPPVDIGSPRVRERTDGQLYWIVGNGLGGMPPFGDLLTEDERWLVVGTVRELQAAP
jgi:mono/diheme cytochrome c family protein